MLAVSPTCPQHKPSAYWLANFLLQVIRQLAEDYCYVKEWIIAWFLKTLRVTLVKLEF